MKTSSYLSSARICGAWQLCVTVAVTLLFAPLLQSCAGSKKATKERFTQTDSVVERLTTVVTPLTVPRSQAALRLNVSDLALMPEGSRYTAHSGQANVEAWQAGDTVYIYAVCDSLQLLAKSQYREIERLKSIIRDSEKEEIKPTPLREKIKYVCVGIVLTIIVLAVWKIKKKITLPK